MSIAGLDIHTRTTTEDLTVVGTYTHTRFAVLPRRTGLVARATVSVIGLQIGAKRRTSAYHHSTATGGRTLPLLAHFTGVAGLPTLPTMFDVCIQVHTRALAQRLVVLA